MPHDMQLIKNGDEYSVDKPPVIIPAFAQSAYNTGWLCTCAKIMCVHPRILLLNTSSRVMSLSVQDYT